MYTQKRLEKLFNAWLRRYKRNPAGFVDVKVVEAKTYGAGVVAYLKQLDEEVAK